MNYLAEINIMPLKELLDPAGKAVLAGLKDMGIAQASDVRIGKHIRLHLNSNTEQEALATAQDAVKKLLANPVMEEAVIKISPLS